MLRRIILIVIVIIIAVGIWFWFTANEVIRSERDVEAKFNDIVTYYVQMNKQYVNPLAQIPSLPDAERISLEKISQDLSSLGGAGGTDDRYKQLLVSQQAIIQYFSVPGINELVSADPHYSEWNTNATSRGEASALILNYNQSLARYNAQRNTVVGKLMTNWTKWPYPEYLSPDGKTATSSIIRF